ncbi:hypothetical protein L0244_16100, partial [bacterium]|nr:hypothetical protein [bacterium]
RCPLPRSIRLPNGKSILIDYPGILRNLELRLLNLKSDLDCLTDKTNKSTKADLEQFRKGIENRLSAIEANQQKLLQLIQSETGIVVDFLVRLKEMEKKLFDAQKDYHRMIMEKQETEARKRMNAIKTAVEKSNGSVIVENLREANQIFETLKETLNPAPSPFKQVESALVEKITQRIKEKGNGS